MQEIHNQRKPHFLLLAGLIVLMVFLTATSMRGYGRSTSQPSQQDGNDGMLPIYPPPPPPKNRRRKNILSGGFVGLLIVLVVLSGLFLARFISAAQHPASRAKSGKPSASTLLPRASVSTLPQHVFESGVIYPRWQPNAYSTTDTKWQTGVKTMKEQTGARWIEIPVLFSQATSAAIEIQPSPQSAPTLNAFSEGVQSAHALGYHVFFVPLMQVREAGGWSGSIQLPANQQQAWFDAYWHAIQPYAQAAAANGVEQMAVGTELQWLQQYAPSSLWEQLISREHGVFKGTLTYDMNWSSLDFPMVSWLKDPQLTMIGVSSYIPLLTTAQYLAPAAMSVLWNQKIKVRLDALATKLGKRVLISEIGYRNSSDALYHTWLANTSAPLDPQEQAGAYAATLSNTLSDPQIAGTFFWGWDGVARFSIKGQPAVQTLNKWYSLPQAS